MRKINTFLFALVLGAAMPAMVYAQQPTKEGEEDLMSMLDSGNTAPAVEHTTATFKATRVINGHSIENVGRGVLDFRISHRFGELKDAKNFFGLDGATTSLGFDYGITDWLMVGVSRATYQKEYEGFAKVKLLRQTTNNHMPVSVSYMGAFSIETADAPSLPAGQEWLVSNRMFYVNQILIARKFSNAFSLQLMPTHIHYNLVPTTAESNNTIAVGVGGRIKLSSRISLNAEYYYRVPGTELAGYHNALAVGFDIETGGHVFQLMFSNATAITERAFIGQSSSDWADGGIRFGFNISRVFTIVRPKGFEGSRNKTW